MAAELDVICIGRSSVDLYGGQVGGRLEDMMSFDKYIGGSPTNISVGTARLGLNSALITRVGDEHAVLIIVAEHPTLLYCSHTSEAVQDVVTKSVASYIVRGTRYWRLSRHSGNEEEEEDQERE